MTLNLCPPAALKKSFGILAYVSEVRRKEILELPSGEFSKAVARLEKELRSANAKERNRLNREKMYDFGPRNPR